MVQFLSFFFLGFLQFLLGFSKVPLFCVTLYLRLDLQNCLFPSGFQAKTLCAFHCTYYAPYFPPLSSSSMLWPILFYEEYK